MDAPLAPVIQRATEAIGSVGLAAPPNQSESIPPDADELVEKVLRKLTRQLAIEGERRGRRP